MNEQAREWQVRLQQAAMKAISEDDIRDLMQTLLKKAKAGDTKALETLLRLTMPTQQQPAAPAVAAQINVDARGRGPRPRLDYSKQPRAALANGTSADEED